MTKQEHQKKIFKLENLDWCREFEKDMRDKQFFHVADLMVAEIKKLEQQEKK